MTLLESAQRVFILLDRCLELLDILGATFSERGLRLSIALLALLGRGVDLARISGTSER